MKLIATIALLLGGAVAFAAPVAAADPPPVGCQPPSCGEVPQPEECQPPTCAPPAPDSPCQPPTCSPAQPPAPAVTGAPCAEPTANDYRAQIVALEVKVAKVQRVADRRAATIQRLRAKIRALR